MTSPLVRAWFAARIVDWADHAYACWRGLLHGLGLTQREWDPIDETFLDVPAPLLVAAGTLPGTATSPDLPPSPPPALHLMLPCGTCGAHSNAPCVTRYGEQTGPHKKRRTAAADATLGGEA